MPRRLIKRYLPDHAVIREHNCLRWLGALLHDPNLWHLNRRSAGGAFFIGLFCAFLPIPGQMIVASAASILARTNLPVAVVLVWVTNPVTMGPIFFFAYKVGTWLLGTPLDAGVAEASGWEWIVAEIGEIWKPLLVGSLVCGTIFGMFGYTSVRLAWHLHLLRRLRRRRQMKKEPAGGEE